MTCQYAHLSPALLRDAVNSRTEGPTDTKTSTINIVALSIVEYDLWCRDLRVLIRQPVKIYPNELTA